MATQPTRPRLVDVAAEAVAVSDLVLMTEVALEMVDLTAVRATRTATSPRRSL